MALSKEECIFLRSNHSMLAGIVESIDLGDEEYDEMESWLEANGFKSFLSKNQIEDIVSNLGQQLSPYTDAQLLKAIRYYWENDAFLDAKNT